MSNDLWYFDGGFNYGVFDDTHTVTEAFSSWLWKGVRQGFIGQVVDFPDEIRIDMTTIGPNGRDSGSPGTPPNGCYKIWQIADSLGVKPPALMATQTLDIGLIDFHGYDLNRKSMGGLVVHGGRLLPFHGAHFPMPKIIFTDSEPSRRVYLSSYPTNTWVKLDLSAWIPENCRLGHFRGRVSAGNGTIWISPSGATPNNPFWRTLQEGPGISGMVDCRVDGDQALWVWTAGSATFEIFCEGFSATEVS